MVNLVNFVIYTVSQFFLKAGVKRRPRACGVLDTWSAAHSSREPPRQPPFPRRPPKQKLLAPTKSRASSQLALCVLLFSLKNSGWVLNLQYLTSLITLRRLL